MKPIFDSPDFFDNFNDFLQKSSYSLLVILSDENTHKYCVPEVLGEMATEVPIEIIEVESGEEHKNIESCFHIWSALNEFGADRQTLLLNIGGGVITDMGGFVASTYLRGIDFVNFPTSLLAMVDASVGGKTGIDLENYKNRIGTFSPAKRVWVYPKFLHTLEEREILSGYAEMLKHGLIASRSHYEELQNLQKIDAENVSPWIEDSVEIKYKIVEEDPMEKGLRKILNFGHTIGHAIESYHLEQGAPMLHGFAVAVGMFYETKLALHLNLLNPKDAENIEKLLEKWYMIPSYNAKEAEHLVEYMQKDKKNNKQDILFSLITEIGKCEYNVKVEEKDILAILIQ